MTAPQFATFVAPAADGDKYSGKNHLNKPLLVKVKEKKEGIITEHTPAPGGAGMIVDLVDLTDNKAYHDVLWMGGQNVDGLTPLLGQVTVIKFVDKIGNTGRHYAAPEDAPEAHPLATAYYAQHGDPFAPKFASVTSIAPAAAPVAAAPAVQSALTAEQAAALKAMGFDPANLPSA